LQRWFVLGIRKPADAFTSLDEAFSSVINIVKMTPMLVSILLSTMLG
jgi:hypothetical protein